AGDLMRAETYNKFFSMHGIVMVFFFLIPSIPAVLGNFLLPLMIGARDVAFPRLNLASWYIYMLGAAFLTYTMVSGGVDTGWTFYTPFSTLYSTTTVISAALAIMILPGMGVVSELITTFARKRTFGYTYIALSSVAIAVLGFLVWGHHLFIAGQSMYASMVFSLLSYLVAVPSGVKVFNWTATLHKGSIEFRTPMLYALGFIGLFTIGGLTGLFLAALGLDIHVTDTY